MKLILSCILMLTIFHQGLSELRPCPEGGCGCVNNYFQASTQTFHMCNDGASKNKTVPVIPGDHEVPVTPSDYEVHPGFGSYKLHLSALTWNDARHVCLNEGAHLAVITSAEEEDILRKMQQSKNAEFIWLGVHEQYQKDDWVTVFDQQLSKLGFVHWHTDQPNNLNNAGEHCVCATVNGMHDFTCDTKLRFLCKINLK